MNMLLRLRFVSLAVIFPLLACFAISGCTSVEVAPGTLAEFKLGELQVLADRDFMAVYNAAKAGAKDMGLFQTQDDRKVIEADLHFRDATDSIVIIKIKEVGTRRTSLKIRYGILPQGNLALTQKVYQAIQKHL
jgi:hypothetical protein